MTAEANDREDEESTKDYEQEHENERPRGIFVVGRVFKLVFDGHVYGLLAALILRLNTIPRLLLKCLGPLCVVDHEEVFVGLGAHIEPRAIRKALRAEHVHHRFIVDAEVAILANVVVVQHVDGLDVAQIVVDIFEAHELEIVYELVTVTNFILDGDLGTDLRDARLE